MGDKTGRVRRIARDLMILVAGCSLPLALSLLAFDPLSLIQQSLGTYFATRAAYPLNVEENLGLLWVWLTADNTGLMLLALLGALVLLTKRTGAGWLALGWFVLTVLTPLQHAPLWLEDHFEPLMFALAVLSGVAVGDRWHRLGAARNSRISLGWCVAGAVVLVAYIASLGHVLAVNQSLLSARNYENDGRIIRPGTQEWAEAISGEREMQRAIDYLRANSAPGEFVVTDDQILAFHAGRQVPPELATLSSRRVRIGAVTEEQLRSATERTEARIVLRWKTILWHHEAYKNWVHERYERGADFDQGRRTAWVLKSRETRLKH
jgi:hypothetical protein